MGKAAIHSFFSVEHFLQSNLISFNPVFFLCFLSQVLFGFGG
jgi:hypothetical protein